MSRKLGMHEINVSTLYKSRGQTFLENEKTPRWSNITQKYQNMLGQGADQLKLFRRRHPSKVRVADWPHRPVTNNVGRGQGYITLLVVECGFAWLCVSVCVEARRQVRWG